MDTLFELRASWVKVVEVYPAWTIEFLGTLAVQVIFLWGFSLLLIIPEATSPSLSNAYKLQDSEKQPQREAIFRCIKVGLLNQAIVSILHLGQLLVLNYFEIRASVYRVDANIPSPQDVLCAIAFCMILREFIYYYIHRLLHHRFFYKHVHKMHHQFTTPISLALIYTHPIEHVVSNIIPISTPPRIWGAHVLTWWLFLAGTLVQACLAHSGYELNLGIWSSNHHDLHHEHFNVNYGLYGLLDRFHGTKYRAREKFE